MKRLPLKARLVLLRYVYPYRRFVLWQESMRPRIGDVHRLLTCWIKGHDLTRPSQFCDRCRWFLP